MSKELELWQAKRDAFITYDAASKVIEKANNENMSLSEMRDYLLQIEDGICPPLHSVVVNDDGTVSVGYPEDKRNAAHWNKITIDKAESYFTAIYLRESIVDRGRMLYYTDGRGWGIHGEPKDFKFKGETL